MFTDWWYANSMTDSNRINKIQIHCNHHNESEKYLILIILTLYNFLRKKNSFENTSLSI